MIAQEEVISNVLEMPVVKSLVIEPENPLEQTMFEWLVENGQAFDD